MGQFTKGQFEPLPLKTVKYTVGKDCYINLRELPATELKTSLHRDVSDKESTYQFMMESIMHCVVDDDGKQVFDSVDDLAEHFPVGLSVLLGIQSKIIEISGLKPKN